MRLTPHGRVSTARSARSGDDGNDVGVSDESFGRMGRAPE